MTPLAPPHLEIPAATPISPTQTVDPGLGDAVATVTELKTQEGNDLAIIGSASLVRTLQVAGLIDHYTLLIHPLILGSGVRLFEGPGPLSELELTGSVVTTTGVIIAHYARR